MTLKEELKFKQWAYNNGYIFNDFKNLWIAKSNKVHNNPCKITPEGLYLIFKRNQKINPIYNPHGTDR